MSCRPFAKFSLLPLSLILAGCLWLDVETIKDYKAPVEQKTEEVLKDDDLADKRALPFDPTLVDRRPHEKWQINTSAAVLKLDVPVAKPDEESDLQVLHPSYAAACAAAKRKHSSITILPSVNLLDGKAKQFDDGLYAALDLAYYRGTLGTLRSHVQLMRAICERLPGSSPARGFFAAGLQLAGVDLPIPEKTTWLVQFQSNELLSKPAGFYTWNEELEQCFRFLRFFQQNFNAGDPVLRDAATVLQKEDRLRREYETAVQFYHRLTNPGEVASLHTLSRAGKQGAAVFPASDCRESLLFEKLFPTGLPPGANLMAELMQRIRSGKIDLAPTDDSGWYEHQVYALETLLLPEKGEERDKLMLTGRYKKRMLEAFQALITKRRETHLRQMRVPLALSAAPPAPMPKQVTPRLRVEPCPSFYVRTARAYAFLTHILEASVGKEGLQALHGLREGKDQQVDLYKELTSQRDLFYGLYLVSCEDIGLRPRFAKEEPVDRERCYQQASVWLETALDDPDLTRDTRVIVTVYHDGGRKISRCWATLGVRMAHLEASYARPPHWKPAKEGEWLAVEASRLGASKYLIAVDEFAEVELKGLRVLNREEFRMLCDRGKNKSAIVRLLQQ